MVLVNCCPIQKTNIQRDLKQRDHISSFFFLLMAEGLSRLVSMDIEITLLTGFRIRGSYLIVSHLSGSICWEPFRLQRLFLRVLS